MTHHPSKSYLPALVEALSQQPELDIITAAVTRFVARRHDWYASAGIRPKADSGIAPSTFQVSTLLQALAWERLDRLDARHFSVGQFQGLLEELLQSTAASALGRELHEALGWEDEVDAHQADPELLKQLVWAALILEIDPPGGWKFGHVAGFDLLAPGNGYRPIKQLRGLMVDSLEWQTKGVEGNRSSEMASLAVCALGPLIPALARHDTPPELLYGSLRWASFAHGIALAELLEPGSSPLLSFQQLIDLPLELSDSGDHEALTVLAATRVLPALQWAITHEVVAHRPQADYTQGDLQKALSALDACAARLSRSTLAVLGDPPHRIRMAEQAFNRLMGYEGYLRNLRMRPTTFWKRVEFSLRNPSPHVASGEFYLLDVFASGHLKNGLDRFEPALSPSQPPPRRDQGPSLLNNILPLLDRLTGVDIPEEYERKFDAWWERLHIGYAAMIEHLLEDIPADDRRCMDQGTVTAYLIQPRPDIDQPGRYGFLIRCEHPDAHFFYEVFPLQARIRRRTDLIEVSARDAVLYRTATNLPRDGITLKLDWKAYNENRAPLDSAAVTLIAFKVWQIPGASQTGARLPLMTGLRQIAETVARENALYDREKLRLAQRGRTGVEFVSANYPPVLRLVEVLVPGLSCFNAVQTDESPTVTCAVEAGLIMALPFAGLFRGVLRIALRSGQVGLLKTLPTFGTVAGGFVKASGSAYMGAFNPAGLGMLLGGIFNRAGWLGHAALARLSGQMSRWAKLGSRPAVFRLPQRINGRIGYPLSGRGAVRAAREFSAGHRISNVRQFDAFLEHHNIFKGNAQRRADMLLEVESGADVRVHVRSDGSRTLIKKDSHDRIYIDLADNSTVTLTARYDYRVLKSWKVENEVARADIRRLAVSEVAAGGRALDPQRLSSVKDAIKSGGWLPPLDVRKTGTGYEVINGNHRLQAAIELKLETVPVLVSGLPLANL